MPAVFLDPVTAYDRLAPEFARIAQRRRPYLDAVENLIAANIPARSRNLLDVGSADGDRPLRIAAAAQIRDLTLLEPSGAMRSKWPTHVHAWPIRAEELRTKEGSFDVVTCLWNVLGHIFPVENRLEVLRQIARLLAPEGLAFIDLSHRYNARHYGAWPTLKRMVQDQFVRSPAFRDVETCWTLHPGSILKTKGHVFTDGEFRKLAEPAGLRIKRVLSIDYQTGQPRKSKFSGHLLYNLARI